MIDATINAIACRCRQARRLPPAGQGSTPPLQSALRRLARTPSTTRAAAAFRAAGPYKADARKAQARQAPAPPPQPALRRRDATGGTSGGLGPNDLRRPHATFNGRRRLRAGRLVRRVRIQRPFPNFLGLELRPEAVARAQESAETLSNCAFLQCNANVDLGRLLGDLANAGRAARTRRIQFPDPHFKKKHRKRRVCTPELAETVARSICASPVSASVYVASDVLDVAEEMRERFAAREELRLEGDYDADGWLCASPLQVQTERERAVLAGLGSTSTAIVCIERLSCPRKQTRD